MSGWYPMDRFAPGDGDEGKWDNPLDPDSCERIAEERYNPPDCGDDDE
jgi:hypothetical protein